MTDLPKTAEEFKPSSAAEQAFAVHAALLKAETADPSLADNPFWRVLRLNAYEQFHNLFVEGR